MITMMLLSLLACGTSEPTGTPEGGAMTGSPAATGDKAQQAADVAKAIDADPSHAGDVLASRNMTPADLEQLMFDVAQDPKLSDEYAKARGK